MDLNSLFYFGALSYKAHSKLFYMSRLLFALLILSFLSSCSSNVTLTKDSYTLQDFGGMKAHFLKSKKPGKQNKVAMLMPDFLDSIKWETATLSKMLHKNGYQVVIPQKPGEKFTAQIALDSRDMRLRSIYFTYNTLVNNGEIDSSTHLILIGVGEGAYVLPEAVSKLPVNQFFMINAGPNSILQELQLKITQQDTSLLNDPLMQLYNIDSLEKLKKQLTEVLTEPKITQSMGYKLNSDWLSYYNNPAQKDLQVLSVPGYVLISKKYPYVTDYSRQILSALTKRTQGISWTYKDIEGNGNLYEPQEMKNIAQTIEGLLINL